MAERDACTLAEAAALADALAGAVKERVEVEEEVVVEEELPKEEVVSVRVEAALELALAEPVAVAVALAEPVAVAVALALSVSDCGIAERSSERKKRARRRHMEVKLRCSNNRYR